MWTCTWPGGVDPSDPDYHAGYDVVKEEEDCALDQEEDEAEEEIKEGEEVPNISPPGKRLGLAH